MASMVEPSRRGSIIKKKSLDGGETRHHITSDMVFEVQSLGYVWTC